MINTRKRRMKILQRREAHGDKYKNIIFQIDAQGAHREVLLFIENDVFRIYYSKRRKAWTMEINYAHHRQVLHDAQSGE